VRNRSSEAWRGDDGFRFGYQIRSRTNAFIEEGQAAAPPRDIARETEPSRRAASAVRGGYCAFVRQWWPASGGTYPRLAFVLLTYGRRRLWSWCEVWYIGAGCAETGGLGEGLAPIRVDVVNRGMIARCAATFSVATVRSAGLLDAAVPCCRCDSSYSHWLQTRFAGDPSRSAFALYFLAGMLPWLPFSEAAGRAPFVMLEHRNFVKKLVFPLETLPVNLALAGLVTQAFALVVFTVLLVASRGYVPVSVTWLPVLLVPQVLLTVGVCWFLAALGVYVRDLTR
jgi:hypothetical protein